MKQKFGIMASYTPVIFKAAGKTVFETQGSLGCLRHGEPKDSHNLIRQGLARLNEAISNGTAPDGANAYDAVTVRGREFSRPDLVKAGLIDKPKKTVCKGLGPKPKRKG